MWVVLPGYWWSGFSILWLEGVQIRTLSSTSLRAVPALSAMYIAWVSAGSVMTARILLCRRIGLPLLLADLSFLREVSARE